MEFSDEQKDFLREFVSFKSYERNEHGETKCSCDLIIRNLVKADVLEWDITTKALTTYQKKNNEPNEVFEWIFFFQYLETEKYLYFLDLPYIDFEETNKTKTIFWIFDKSRIRHRETAKEEDESFNFVLSLFPKEKYFSITKLGNDKVSYCSLSICKDIKTIYTKQLDVLIDFIRKTMHPTHKLKELVNNDFNTPEQKQSDLQNGFSRRTLRLTMITLAISTFFLVVSTILGVLGYCKDDNTKTDPEQHIELIKNTSADTTQIKIVSPIPQETKAKKPINTTKTIHK